MPASNEEEIDGKAAAMAAALAQLLHLMRPDWQVRSLTTLLLKNRGYASFPAVCEAAVRLARNPGKGPGVLFLDGPHWVADSVAAVALPRGPACVDHPEEDAHRCRCCIADIKLGQRPAAFQGKHFEPEGVTE